MTNSWDILLQIVVLLSVSLILGTVLSRFKQSPIIGYLLAGMFLGGPGSLAIIHENQHIELVAELGVSLLLFSLGLEFSWKRLKSLGANSLFGGVLQVAITSAAATLALWSIKFDLRESIALGAMISLSSTACVLRVLMERGESDSSHGRNSIAILLIQDIAVVAHAIVLTLLTKGGSFFEVSLEVAKTLTMVALLAITLYIIINFIAVRLLSKMSLEQNRELAIILSVVVGLGSTWAAHKIGISPALGAFVSGMFLGSSNFATQVRADISSIRIVLLTLFFSSAGMVADPIWIFSNIFLVLFSAALLIAAKTITIWIILSAIGQPITVAFSTALTISQIGEFAFVLGAIAFQGNVVSKETYQLIISTAIFTLFLTPYLVAAAPKLGLKIAKKLKKPLNNKNLDQENKEKPDLIIIGFGPTAKTAIKTVLNTEINITVIELNEIGIRQAKKLGLNTLLGDARQIDVLEHAGITHAKTILLTLPDYRTCSTIIGLIKKLNKNARIVMRSRYHHNSEIFRKKGADIVIGDEESVGNKLSEELIA